VNDAVGRSAGDGPGWTVRYRPAQDDLRNGARPDLLVAELLALGRGQAVPEPSDVPALEDLDPARACLSWRIVLPADVARRDIEDVFVFSDEADVTIEAPPDPGAPAAEPVPDPSAVAEGPAAAADPALRAIPPDRKADDRNEMLRVPSERVDRMMDALGELVIAQSKLVQGASRHRDPALHGAVEEVERLILSLRETALSMRMLPIESVFGRFRRVVRDLSTKLGKEVELQTRGGTTEVDKNVLDRLADPLVHMLRNALDHGLETPAVRQKAGKPRSGTVRLTARQEGGGIVIEIADDGRGLDPDAILARAVERGLVAADADLADADVFELIFAPGFSTAETVTDVSGRGVGMDAVRQTADGLGGRVDIASKPGAGTRFTLTLPVSLAIVDGLRVRVGRQVCILPLSSVDECVDLSPASLSRRSGRRSMTVRGELLPILPLRSVLGWTGTGAEAGMRAVIVRAGGARIGLAVDDILGQAQTVVKPLTTFHAGCEGLAGATILGDGSVALILDVAAAVAVARADRRDAA
jgi:two-component system chemotaxis sensor kinase CheA